MKITLVTDAWMPQVNGVVTTLVELVRELGERGAEVQVIQPGQFRTRPCPGYAGIPLAVAPARGLAQAIEAFRPDAIHIATEGPLGWAARRHCLRHGLAFTTAFHTKFPEIVHAALRVPLGLGYAVMRHFHRPSSGVMVPTPSVLEMLQRRGLRNLRPWTHGVDTELFHPGRADPAALRKRLGLPWNARILVFAGLGSYALHFSVIDTVILFVVGVVGFLMRRYGYPVSPMVVGGILGPMAEEQLRKAMAISQGNPAYLVHSPFAIAVYVALAIIVAGGVWLKRRRARLEASPVLTSSLPAVAVQPGAGDVR